jgi:hypothetical protein
MPHTTNILAFAGEANNVNILDPPSQHDGLLQVGTLCMYTYVPNYYDWYFMYRHSYPITTYACGSFKDIWGCWVVVYKSIIRFRYGKYTMTCMHSW